MADDVIDDQAQQAEAELDAYTNYADKKAEVDAMTAQDGSPIPTSVVLETTTPTESTPEASSGLAEAGKMADAKAKLIKHKNALDEQVHQDVMRMAKEMGVDYEDLFAASHKGSMPSKADEPESKAEKAKESKDPKAEQKEAAHASAPRPKQEHYAPAGPRPAHEQHAALKAEMHKQQAHSKPDPGPQGHSEPAKSRQLIGAHEGNIGPTREQAHPSMHVNPHNTPEAVRAQQLRAQQGERVSPVHPPVEEQVRGPVEFVHNVKHNVAHPSGPGIQDGPNLIQKAMDYFNPKLPGGG